MLKFSFLISIFLNFFILIIMERIFSKNDESSKTYEKPFVAKINIVKNQTAVSAQKQSSRSKMSLKDLGVSKNASSVFDAHSELFKIGSFGESVGMKEGLDSSIFYFLHEYISSNMHYPHLFKGKDIQGYVNARLAFSRAGMYTPQLSKFDASSRYLKVLVQRIFAKIFKKRLPFDLSFIDHRYFILDLRFLFISVPTSDESFINRYSYVNGQKMGFLIQNEVSSGLTYEEVVKWVKDNFTSAGKARKMYKEEQFKNFIKNSD